VGCVEQKPVVDSSGKAQMQPVLHGGWPTPQLPPQAKPWGSLRNWRAESVPAPRTAVSIAASNRFFKKFQFISLLLFPIRNFTQTIAACYFAAGTAPANFFVQNPVSGVVKEQTHALVGQGWVMLQVPLQVVV